MKDSHGFLGMVAIVATLLISITSGQALAEEKAWVLQERTLPCDPRKVDS